MKSVNSRELQSALRKAGYEKIRCSGSSHAIFSNGEKSISVPITSSLNHKIATKIIVTCGLKNLI